MKPLLFFLWLFLPTHLISQYRASEWEARDQWQNTQQILNQLDIQPSMKVADVGCHEGYLTMKLSPLVGPDGTVYAVDIDKYKLNKLDRRLNEQSISNVTTVHGDEDNPNLPEGQLDRIVILDTYHEIKDYQVVLAHFFRSLKPGGRLVMVEPIATSRESWSRKQQAEKHEISIRYAIEDLKRAGFQINKEINPFIDRSSKNDQMWMLVATRPENN